METKPLVLAHRGVMNLAPENTKLAFQLAYLFGFDGVELDVHMSLDQKLVIIHDESTLRTTKVGLLIKDTSYEKLNLLNYAAFWKYTLPSQRLLTLDEFFRDFLSFFQLVNIELKTDVCEYPGIEEKLVALIHTLPLLEQEKLLISSFNFATLERFKALLPSVKIAFLFYKIKDFRTHKHKIHSVCDFLNPRLELYLLYQKEIDALNKKYFFWTINSLRAWNKALKISRAAGLICNQLFV